MKSLLALHHLLIMKQEIAWLDNLLGNDLAVIYLVSVRGTMYFSYIANKLGLH